MGHKCKNRVQSVKKTAILFINKRNYSKPNNCISWARIQILNQIKYLGVILDRKLQFYSHIKYITEKYLRKTLKLSAMTRNTWGIKSQELKTLYIEPIIVCGTDLCTKPEQNKNKFVEKSPKANSYTNN